MSLSIEFNCSCVLALMLSRFCLWNSTLSLPLLWTVALVFCFWLGVLASDWTSHAAHPLGLDDDVDVGSRACRFAKYLLTQIISQNLQRNHKV